MALKDIPKNTHYKICDYDNEFGKYPPEVIVVNPDHYNTKCDNIIYTPIGSDEGERLKEQSFFTQATVVECRLYELKSNEIWRKGEIENTGGITMWSPGGMPKYVEMIDD